jgi:hypothetical protein
LKDEKPVKTTAVLPPSKHPRIARLAVPAVAVIATLSVVLATAAQAASEPVPLGAAESFGVLAGAGITNTGPTTITGDIGTFPTTSVTDLGTVTLIGTDHAGDAVTQQAKTDLVTAYDQAAGQLPVSAVPVELGGTVLTPGVYSSGGALGLTGTLTLDANGDPDAVFVFQTPSTLITATDSVVSLIDGAQACHVFWQVTSSADLGVRTQFAGTIIALTTISLKTQATVQGRVLARNGEVTLDSNTITRAPCATTPVVTAPTASPSAPPQVRTVPRGGVATGDGSSVRGPSTGTPALPFAILAGGALVAGIVAAGSRARRLRATR